MKERMYVVKIAKQYGGFTFKYITNENI